MEFLKLYDAENRDLLCSMSWLNRNSNFDKSIGSFTEIDLFTFLENIIQFDYEKDIFYDDIYYILEYAEKSILHLINNINKEIKREHKIMPISQAREFDKKTILWLSRQDGRTIKEKLKNNKIKAVKRYRNVDTYENRIFKILLKKLVLVEEKKEHIQSNGDFISKIRRWLRSEDAKNINEYGSIVYNNMLLHHPHYSKIFKSYKWLNRLDEKLTFYSTIYPQELKSIIKFELLAQLQFSTTEAKVLPDILDSDSLKSFNTLVNNSLIKINLEKHMSKVQDSMLKDKFNFKSIKKFAEYMLKNQLHIDKVQNRSFNIDINSFDNLYIDLFRLFPIAKINTKMINFPITLQQKINGKIVNANNTKIINLKHELYTLPEILKTYDIEILRRFLEDFEKYFKDKQLNYIVPDYVNIFEFSQVKKTINSYFPNNRNIPKSILAGLKYLFKGNLQENNTLVYIQKNHDNDLYITPLLVKYDKTLQNITNGLYLEKHPTKKLQEENDIVSELTYSFKDKNLSEKLLSKFLQNGIKGIKNEKIAFYFNEEIIYLKNSKKLSKSKNRTTKIKSLFTNKNLFKKEYIEIHDTNEDNLYNFEKLLKFEQDGNTLWKEHLPRLAMGDMPMHGYFGEFILVDDDSIVCNRVIEIKNYFTIPAKTSELSFPLIFGDENINSEAYITSNELPFEEDVKCELLLTYDYEDETPYKLMFVPSDTSLKPLNIKWKKTKNKSFEKLIYPEYPDIKKPDNLIEDVIIKEFFKLKDDFMNVKNNRFDEKKPFFLSSSYVKAMFSQFWQNGNSIINTQNEKLKRLVFESVNRVLDFKNNFPPALKNNIYLFLSYIQQDLTINEDSKFILNEFRKREHLYGLSLGCLNSKWQEKLFMEISTLAKWKQIIILNIALWRCSEIIKKINKENLQIYLIFIEDKLQTSEYEKDVIVYLEFLLAVLRMKGIKDSNILHPNNKITKKLLKTLKKRSKYFVENYQLNSKISFGTINKPDILKQMPDVLYAVIYYLSNEDIENKIIINEIKA